MKTKIKPGHGYAMTRKVIPSVMYPPDKRTKIIPVWHVEYCWDGRPLVATEQRYEDAETLAKVLEKNGRLIAITGPHQHRVPA